MSLRAKRFGAAAAAFGLAVVALVVSGFVVAGATPEQINRLWTSATLDAAGNATIHEAIDYDFGFADRHGIYRVIPGVNANEAQARISSPNAPAMFTATDKGSSVEYRIGDPNKQIRGAYRYNISYRHEGIAESDWLAWNVFGDEWTVPARTLEGHIVSNSAFENARCEQARNGTIRSCEVTQVEPGHLVVRVASLEKHERVTVFASRLPRQTASPAVPVAPTDTPGRKHIDIISLWPVIPAMALGYVVARSRVRRAGRERVGAGDAADAAFASNEGTYRLVDAADLGDYATVEFAPPKGLTPPQGGVVHREQIEASHQASWLMQAALDGQIDIRQEGKKTILRPMLITPPYDAILTKAFGGRDHIELGKYDSSFAKAWSDIKSELSTWQKNSEYWDAASVKRMHWVVGLGILGLIAAMAVIVSLLVWGAGRGAINVALLALPFVVVGAAIACLCEAWELRVRTPEGSAMWLRLESFRRFLHASEAEYVQYAAEHNLLREYTAWAVALGEVKHWTKGMKDAAVFPDNNSASLGYFVAANTFASSAQSTSTSSSSSGGSSGGGGGGGGGSW